MTAQTLIDQLDKAPSGERDRFLKELKQHSEIIIDRIFVSLRKKMATKVLQDGIDGEEVIREMAQAIVSDLQVHFASQLAEITK